MNMKIMSINNQPQKAPTFKGGFEVVKGIEHLDPEEIAALPALIKKFELIGAKTDTFNAKFGEYRNELESDGREGCTWRILPIEIDAEISGIPISTDLTIKTTRSGKLSYTDTINKWVDKAIANISKKSQG